MISSLKFHMKSGSMSNLAKAGNAPSRTNFSTIVSGGTISRNVTSTVQRKALANKFKGNVAEDDFKVGII